MDGWAGRMMRSIGLERAVRLSLTGRLVVLLGQLDGPAMNSACIPLCEAVLWSLHSMGRE